MPLICLKLLLTTLLLTALLENVQLASAARIPFWRSGQQEGERQNHGMGGKIKMSGFSPLARYVCPKMTNGIGLLHLETRDDRTIDLPRDINSLNTVLQQIQSLESEIHSLLARLRARDFADSGSANSNDVLTADSDIWVAVVGPAGSISEQKEDIAALSAAVNSATQTQQGLASTDASAAAVDSPSLVPAATSDVLPSDSSMPGPSNEPADTSQMAPAPPIPMTLDQLAASSIRAGLRSSAVASEQAASATTIPDNVDTQSASSNSPKLASTVLVATVTDSPVSVAPVSMDNQPATSAAAIDSAPATGAASPAGGLVVLPFLPRDANCAFLSGADDDDVYTTRTTTITSRITAETYITVIMTTQAEFDETVATTSMVNAGPNQIHASVTLAGPPQASIGEVFLENAAASQTPSTQAAHSMAYTTSVFSETSIPAIAKASSSIVPDSSSYVFDAESSENIAVYFGQTGATSLDSLSEQCADPSIDIVIIAFVVAQLNGGIYPEVNFGSACGGQTGAMQSQAPGLLSCPSLASKIEQCQSTYGKKVLLSIGGATSQITFTTADAASSFADILWNLFGPPGNIDDDLRPFGDVTIDGFDIDNEDKSPDNYDTFASTLRAHYDNTSSKTYYLSSTPQCPYPDASNPLAMLLLCDFVWVQFYNNPDCEIGSSNFSNSVQAWSSRLGNSALSPLPKLYIGAPSFSGAGSTAYSAIGNAAGMETIAKEVKSFGLPNLGGIMFWDGSEGLDNIENGETIFDYAKTGLTS